MKSTYEIMGGNYQQNGDYLLPDFEVPEYPVFVMKNGHSDTFSNSKCRKVLFWLVLSKR